MVLQVVVTRSVVLWVEARGVEFSWRYVRLCADSNVALVWAGCLAAAVWLALRSRRRAVLALLVLAPYRHLLDTAAARLLHLAAWPALAFRAAHALTVALLTLAFYAELAVQTNTSF